MLFGISTFEQNITRHVFKQQGLILSTPPAGQEIFVVVTDNDQIHLQAICKPRDFIDGLTFSPGAFSGTHKNKVIVE